MASALILLGVVNFVIFGWKQNASDCERLEGMSQMMNGYSTMWGMGFGGLVFAVIVILIVAALVKYVFLNK